MGDAYRSNPASFPNFWPGRFSGAPDRALHSKCLQMASVAPTTGLRVAPKALSLYRVYFEQPSAGK